MLTKTPRKLVCSQFSIYQVRGSLENLREKPEQWLSSGPKLVVYPLMYEKFYLLFIREGKNIKKANFKGP